MKLENLEHYTKLRDDYFQHSRNLALLKEYTKNSEIVTSFSVTNRALKDDNALTKTLCPAVCYIDIERDEFLEHYIKYVEKKLESVKNQLLKEGFEI